MAERARIEEQARKIHAELRPTAFVRKVVLDAVAQMEQGKAA